MPLPLLVPLLLGGIALTEQVSIARRKPPTSRPDAGPRRSEAPSPTNGDVRAAYRMLLRGDLPDPVPARLARGLDCLISGILAPMAAAGVSGRLVPIADPSSRSAPLRDGLAFGLRLDADSTAPAAVLAGLPGVEALPPNPGEGRDFWIFGVPDLRVGAALLEHLSVNGPPVVATTGSGRGAGLDVTGDRVADFYFDGPGEGPPSHDGAPADGGAVDFSGMERVPV